MTIILTTHHGNNHANDVMTKMLTTNGLTILVEITTAKILAIASNKPILMAMELATIMTRI